ncbi:MAG: hypothetical protein GXO35_00705, partial [Gammaproteobacteria bacterium]|nr:hypothetical protein [Gammaproteobacteria bacterium]
MALAQQGQINIIVSRIKMQSEQSVLSELERVLSNGALAAQRLIISQLDFSKVSSDEVFKAISDASDANYRALVFDECTLSPLWLHSSLYLEGDQTFPEVCYFGCIFGENFIISSAMNSALRNGISTKLGPIKIIQKPGIEAGEIKGIEIDGDVVEEGSYIKIIGYTIKSIVIRDMKFRGKFEFKENIVKEKTEIENSNFEKVTDFFKTKFMGCFRMEKCIVNGFMGFEDCHFQFDKKASETTVFRYVTFMSLASFRGAMFNGKLDI